MEPGEIIALAALVFAIFSFVAGALIKSRDTRIAELIKENDAKDVKIDVLHRTIDAKQEVVDEQRRQLDRLLITAEIQEKLLSGLPRYLPPSSKDTA